MCNVLILIAILNFQIHLKVSLLNFFFPRNGPILIFLNFEQKKCAYIFIQMHI